jgi:hypothetical protein
MGPFPEPFAGGKIIEIFDASVHTIVDEEVLPELPEVSAVCAFSVEVQGAGSPLWVQSPECLVQLLRTIAPLRMAPSCPMNSCRFFGRIVCWR